MKRVTKSSELTGTDVIKRIKSIISENTDWTFYSKIRRSNSTIIEFQSEVFGKLENRSHYQGVIIDLLKSNNIPGRAIRDIEVNSARSVVKIDVYHDIDANHKSMQLF